MIYDPEDHDLMYPRPPTPGERRATGRAVRWTPGQDLDKGNYVMVLQDDAGTDLLVFNLSELRGFRRSVEGAIAFLNDLTNNPP